MEWFKVTEKLPISGKDYLVWTGSKMIVSDAEFYDIEELKKHYPKELVDNTSKHIGYFEEFCRKYYFDNPNVYWAELPESPK